MKIQLIKNSKSLNDKVIEKAISHLIVMKNGPLANEKITFKKVSKQGGQAITAMSSFLLRHLYEITAQGEGCFYNKTALSYGQVQLGLNGASVALEDNEYFLLSLSDLEDDKEYNVIGSESPVSTPYMMVYEKITVTSGNESRKMQVAGTAQIVLPHAKLTALDIKYNNGNTVTTYPEELTVMSGVANDLVVLEENAVVYGSKDLHTLDVQHAIEYEVFTTSEGYSFYTIRAEHA